MRIHTEHTTGATGMAFHIRSLEADRGVLRLYTDGNRVIVVVEVARFTVSPDEGGAMTSTSDAPSQV